MNITELKRDRLSEPERYLLEIFDGLVEYVNDDYPDSIFYITGDKVMFKYNPKTQTLWYSQRCIWEVFRDKFYFIYRETNELVQDMVSEHLNLMVKTTSMGMLYT